MMWPKLLLVCIAFALLAGALAEDYVVGPDGTLCENGMIDNKLECEKAAQQLNFDFVDEEEESNFPGGCYMTDEFVYFNKNFAGTSHQDAAPICGQVASVCPSSCKCKSGQHAVDKSGNCNYWCSKYGYCGETEAHKNGVDCRGCAEDQEEVCFDVETFVVKWGEEMSWEIGPCEQELKNVGGNGPVDGSQHSSECCVPKDKTEFPISCQDSYGDGWHGGYLEIEGKEYCTGFSDGRNFNGTLTLDPVDCSWDEFGEWSECSKTCGGGERSRSRGVLIPAKYGGKACEGSASQVDSCNEQSCPEKDNCTCVGVENFGDGAKCRKWNYNKYHRFDPNGYLTERWCYADTATCGDATILEFDTSIYLKNGRYGPSRKACSKVPSENRCTSWPSLDRGVRCTGGDDWILLDKATFTTSKCESLCRYYATGEGCCLVNDKQGCWWKGRAKRERNLTYFYLGKGNYSAASCVFEEPRACEPYSVSQCKEVANSLRLGFQLKNGTWLNGKFYENSIGDQRMKGCYMENPTSVYFGTGGSKYEERDYQKANAYKGISRPPGVDCRSNCMTDFDCNSYFPKCVLSRFYRRDDGSMMGRCGARVYLECNTWSNSSNSKYYAGTKYDLTNSKPDVIVNTMAECESLCFEFVMNRGIEAGKNREIFEENGYGYSGVGSCMFGPIPEGKVSHSCLFINGRNAKKVDYDTGYDSASCIVHPVALRDGKIQKKSFQNIYVTQNIFKYT